MKNYIESIVSVNAIIIYENKILLQRVVKRENKIGLPGGKLDIGESFDKALKREILEETGIEYSSYDYKKVAILHDFPDTTCKHIYIVNLKEKINSFNFNDDEISECFWLEFDKIPQDICLYRNSWVYYVIQDYINGIFNTNKLYTLKK